MAERSMRRVKAKELNLPKQVNLLHEEEDEESEKVRTNLTCDVIYERITTYSRLVSRSLKRNFTSYKGPKKSPEKVVDEEIIKVLRRSSRLATKRKRSRK